MRRLTSVTLIFVLVVPLATFAPLTAQDRPVADAARPGFESIQAEDMKAILTFLASDELEGRETGERGQEVAAAYLASQYRKYGLQPTPGLGDFSQAFQVVRTRFGKENYLSVHSERGQAAFRRTFEIGKDFLPFSRPRQSLQITAPVVFAGYGIQAPEYKYDDYKGLSVKDRIVLVLDHEPQERSTDSVFEGFSRTRHSHRRTKTAVAERHGALALLIVGDPLNDQPSFAERFAGPWVERFLQRQGMSLAESGHDPLPTFMISEAIAAELLAGSGQTLADLQRAIDASLEPNSFVIPGKRVTLEMDMETDLLQTANVVAFLEGADPQLKEEVVVFSAHYDHLGRNEDEVYNGADDDGSGTTALLEVAEAFTLNPVAPKRSLLFVDFTGEEKGLLGSRYYVAHPVLPLERTVSALNLDMIGRNDPNGIYIIGSDFLSSDLHRINEQANLAVGLELDYTYNRKSDPNRFYYRSDHYNFARNGVPIIFYFSGTHADYHKPTDTADKIDYAKMEKVARLVYLTGWQVANLDHAPRIDSDLRATDEE